MTHAPSWFSDPDALLTELRRGGQERLAAPQIAGYEEFRLLSRGGQGLVFGAIQRSTRRRVAVKVLLDGAFASPAARRRFEREIELVATLEHPGIVRIFDSGTTADGRLYYVMEFIEGVPLDTWVERESASASERPAARFDDRLTLLAAAGEAVNYAHQRGVIHRDLKPANILVDSRGQPHVLDFGLAKLADDDSPRSRAVSVSGQFLGSVPWASPEQADGSAAAVDIRTDVYALGVIAYQLLTGEFPYDVSGSLAQALENIKAAQPRRPSALASGVDDELDTIVLKALSKEPGRRYQSAGDFAADIRRRLRGEPIDAKRDSAWYLLRKTASRHRLVLAAAALIAVTLVTGVAATFWQWRQAEQQRVRAERRFNDVRELARTFMFDVHDRVADLAGSRPARELLAETATRYLQKLAAESGGDESLVVEIAAGHQRVGDILGNPFTPNLGDTTAALQEYQRGLAVLAPFANSGSPATRRTLATLQNRMGDVLSMRGDRAAALENHQQALDTFTKLSDADPGNRTDRRNLGATYLKIGDTLARTEDQAGALRQFQAAIQVFEQLLAQESPDERDRFNLQICCSKAGFSLGMLGESEAGLRQHLRALEISTALAAADPANAARQRSVSINHNQVGAAHLAQGDPASAIEHFQAAFDISDRLAAADPANRQAQSDLSYTHNKIGEAHWMSGRQEEALIHFESAMRIRAALAEADPDNGSAQRDLVVSCSKVGETRLGLAQRTDLPRPERKQHAEIGTAAFARCLDVLATMQKQGHLGDFEASMPEDARDGAAQCAKALEELSSPASAQIDSPGGDSGASH